MADCKMVPRELTTSIRRNPKLRAECKVYDALASSLTKNFHVYYSKWWFNADNPMRKQRDGESDFVIVHKDLGAIFIEVKGGQVRRDEEGQWFSGRHEIKDPIRQARICKYQFRKGFQKRFIEKFGNASLPSPYFNHFVLLPDSSKTSSSYLGEGLTIEQFGFAEDMENIGKKIDDFFDYQLTGVQFPTTDRLGEKGIEVFEDMFHQKFSFESKLGTQIRINNLEIQRLTKEQEDFERQFGHWQKLWVEGPAGSGKTSLALRKILEAPNSGIKSAIFLCRNKILANYISDLVSKKIAGNYNGMDLNYEAFTFDKFCFDLSGFSYYGNQESTISAAFDVLSNGDKAYDLIVIDEAQDFEDSWWLVISQLLHENSILWIFSDSNQRIWQTKKPEIPGIGEPIRLFDVIRNTVEIGELATHFYEGGGHDLKLIGPMGSKVIIQGTNNLLSDVSRKCKSLISYEGVNKNQIAIIHQKTLSKSIVNELLTKDESTKYKFTFTDDFKCWEKNILISSVHKFKGMEADVVIFFIDDVSRVTDEELYVGVTRAISHLVIMCEKEIVETVKRRLEIFL